MNFMFILWGPQPHATQDQVNSGALLFITHHTTSWEPTRSRDLTEDLVKNLPRQFISDEVPFCPSGLDTYNWLANVPSSLAGGNSPFLSRTRRCLLPTSCTLGFLMGLFLECSFRAGMSPHLPSPITLPQIQLYLSLTGHPFICCAVLSCLVMSDSLRPHGFLCPSGFSWHEYWSGLPCPPPEDLPNPGIESRSSALLIETEFTYHKIHHFKVQFSVVFTRVSRL